MNRVRRRYSLVATVLTLLLGLGCTAAPSGAQERTTITWGFRDAPGSREFVAEVIQRFEAMHPDLRIEWRPMTTGDLMNQIPVQIAGGVAPDVFEMWGAHSQDWAEQGWLLDLEPYVRRDLAAELDDFAQPALAGGILYHGPRAGIRYGLPRYVHLFTTRYNKPALAEAGLASIPELAAAGGWDMNDLREYARKLTRSDGGTVTRWGLTAPTTISNLSTWLLSFGGGFFAYPEDPLEFILDWPESIAALEFLQDLKFRDEVVGGEWLRGTSAIHVGEGLVNLIRFEEEIGESFDWEVAEVPRGPAGRAYVISKDLWGINAATPHPEAAWRFVRFLVSQEVVSLHTRFTKLQPARRSVALEYLELAPGRNLELALQAMAVAHVNRNTVLVNSGAVVPIINDIINKVLVTGALGPRQAVEQVADQVRAIMARH